MAVHQLKAVQHIPGNLPEIWRFFSQPGNLATITPKEMDFRVRSEDDGKEIYPGQIIEYTVRPLLGIPLYWMTEITHVEHESFFVDEQRKGPYAIWHHQHHFKEVEGGVQMTDLVHYNNPLGFLGEIANKIMVRRKLTDLFEYRVKKIGEIFGAWPGEKVVVAVR